MLLPSIRTCIGCVPEPFRVRPHQNITSKLNFLLKSSCYVMSSRLPEAYHLWNIPPAPHIPSPHSYILFVWSLESPLGLPDPLLELQEREPSCSCFSHIKQSEGKCRAGRGGVLFGGCLIQQTSALLPVTFLQLLFYLYWFILLISDFIIHLYIYKPIIHFLKYALLWIFKYTV